MTSQQIFRRGGTLSRRNMRTENLTNKNIREFTENDTLYIQKREGDGDTAYYVRFISFARGVVTGSVIESNKRYAKHWPDDVISARLFKCFLWGKGLEDKWECCHWFQKDGFVK